ncbi:MAG: Fur family transcriptional regulator [Micrococcaceae bacterium]
MTKTRNTKQKTLVLEALENQQDFLSAQALFEILQKSGANVSQATVYRALQAMAEEGSLDTLNLGASRETLYRLCGAAVHHHHLVCTNCGKSIDFEAPKMEHYAQKIAKDHGFTEAHHTIEVFGLCPECSAKP